MPRKLKPSKLLVHVFYEGETEQAYAKFLKKKFSDVAVIEIAKKTGLVPYADKLFKNENKYKNAAEAIDEIWFFFDVERNDVAKWDARLKIIKHLRKLRKKPNIKVRLLMTTGCIEYWLTLHFKNHAPLVNTEPEKINMLKLVQQYEPTYKKGDSNSIFKIAENYKTAMKNAQSNLKNMLSDGLPCLEDTDERNKWLHTECKTFSTVFEAIQYLENINSSET